MPHGEVVAIGHFFMLLYLVYLYIDLRCISELKESEV